MGFRERLAYARGKSTQLPNNLPFLRHPQGVEFVYVVAPNSLQADRGLVQGAVDAGRTAEGLLSDATEQIAELEAATGIAPKDIERLLFVGRAVAKYDKTRGLSQTGVHSAVSSGLTLLTRDEDAQVRQASQFVVRMGYFEGRVEFDVPGRMEPGFIAHSCLGLFVDDLGPQYIAIREYRVWTELCLPVVGALERDRLANGIMLAPIESRPRAIHFAIDAIAKAAGMD